jgi:hypothetical protein
MNARHITASLLALAATAALAADPADGPKSGFGAALVCKSGASASVHAVASKTPGFKASEADGAWAVESMTTVGYPAALPSSEPARSAALRAATLLHRGNIIAAKMANDEASKTVAGYKGEKFAASFESLLTVLTQPVRHASYPSTVRAAGEQWPADADHSHTHGVDMEMASASLLEIIQRAGMSMAALGKAYEKPAVRFYILANGFRDPIALEASRAGVCGERLDAETIKKLDVSARFMAMPATISGEEPKK